MVFVYSIHSLLDDVVYQVYVRHLLIMKNEIIRGCRGWHKIFNTWYKLHTFLAKVSADRNSV